MATEMIEVDQAVAAALRLQAANRNIPVADLLKEIAASRVDTKISPPVSEEEWIRELDEASGNYPVLPDGFSRADIYFDHD